MADGYILTPKDRDDLARQADQYRKEIQNSKIQDARRQAEKAPEVYVAVPPKGEGIPARVGDTPGSNLCCLYRLVLYVTPTESWALAPIISRVDGKPIRELVFNIYDKPITPAWPPYEYYIRIWRAKDGKWMCEDPLDREETGTTSSTTTTNVPDPYPVAPCEGGCWWIWDNTEKIWNLDEDNCEFASTTTTSSTSSTTTTAETCLCPTHPDSTTTSTTSSTTTTAPCECQYPQFCGTEEGECTQTFCGKEKNDPPECGQTTTTSTSTSTTTTTTSSTSSTTTTPGETTSTTTTPDCATTTTSECLNGEGICKWLCTNVGWIATQMDCPLAQPGVDCGCDEPGPIDDCNLCDKAETPCLQPTTTTTTTDDGLLGGDCDEGPCCFGCWWIWGDAEGGIGNQWIYMWRDPDPLTASGCRPYEAAILNNDPCACTVPSFPGTVDCGWVKTDCYKINGNGTTSSTTTTQPADPCYPTTTSSTSTSTSSTSTTTTTPHCGTATCIWEAKADLTGWDWVSGDCPDDCPCAEPPFDPEQPCQKQDTPCYGGTTTSSTTTSTSTTSTSTTTTSTTSSTTTTACGHVYSEDFESGTLNDWVQQLGSVGIDSTTFHGGAKSMRISGNTASTARLTYNNCAVSLLSFWYFKEADVVGAEIVHPSGSTALTVSGVWTQVTGVVLVYEGGGVADLDINTDATGIDTFLYIDDIQITNMTDP